LGALGGSSAAAPNPNANCVGKLNNFGGTEGGAFHGQSVASIAQLLGGVGQFTGPAASTDDCTMP
jgi:hypothetical protein